MQLQIVAKPPV